MNRLYLLILSANGAELRVWMESWHGYLSLPCINLGHSAPRSVDPTVCAAVREMVGDSAICGYFLHSGRSEAILEVHLTADPSPSEGQWYPWDELSQLPLSSPESFDCFDQVNLKDRFSELSAFRNRLQGALKVCFSNGVQAVWQRHHGSNAAVFKVQADTGLYWLKVHYLPIRHWRAEQDLPFIQNRVLRVYAEDPQGLWECSYDLGERLRTRDITEEVVRKVLMEWADCQVASIGYFREHETSLPLRDHHWFLQGIERLRNLEEKPEGLDEALEHCEKALDLLKQSGLPLGLVHGDFHLGNVCVKDQEFGFLDFDYTGISYPILDYQRFETSERYYNPRVRRAYLNRFSDWVPTPILIRLWQQVCPLGLLYKALHVDELKGTTREYHKNSMRNGFLSALVGMSQS